MAGPAPGTKRAERLARRRAASMGEDEAFIQPLLPKGAPLDPHFDMGEPQLTRAELRARRKEEKQHRHQQQKREKEALRSLAPEELFSPPEADPEGQGWISGKPVNPAEMDAIAQLFAGEGKGAPVAGKGKNGPEPAAEPGVAGEGPPARKSARTGKPRRFRFSQGDAHDIDAIDD